MESDHEDSCCSYEGPSIINLKGNDEQLNGFKFLSISELESYLTRFPPCFLVFAFWGNTFTCNNSTSVRLFLQFCELVA